MISCESFVSKQFELLELERDSEIEENKIRRECRSIKDLQKQGVCLTKLKITSTSPGLFGKYLVNFEPYSGNHFPSNSIATGDIVGIANSATDIQLDIIISGVVVSICSSYITVSFERNSGSSVLKDDTQYLLIKLANDVTYRRLKLILKKLQNESGRSLQLRNVLFGYQNPSDVEVLHNELSFYNSNLNEMQKEAVKFACAQKEVAILHGPPGTGKTTTVVECILQAAAQKLKVLACAPSNIAVDNLVEKLAKYKIKLIRIGHPARFLPDIQQYSLDAIISRYEGSDVISDLYKEADNLKVQLDETQDLNTKKLLYAETKNLQSEIKKREINVVTNALKNADVILSTLISASTDGPLKYLRKDHFDVCFIDECSQALEVACWVPIFLVTKCILSGDFNQLPPTIVSKKAAKEGLALTLMERLLQLHGNEIKIMLTVQYRMHQNIMEWPSKAFYFNELIAHDSVKYRLLKDLPGVEDNEDTNVPLLLIDTVGCHFYELETCDELSKANEGEAYLVALHVKKLTESGVSLADIAIITPYNLQVELIKSKFSKQNSILEISSVDGFQGREKEAVILSLVRSNNKGEVGFLSEDRRINVAITRAKRHLCVICNSETVSHHSFLKSFVEHCNRAGEMRSAFQYEVNILLSNYCNMEKKSIKRVHKKDKTSKCLSNGVPGDIVSTKNGKSSVSEVNHSIVLKEKYEQIIQDFKESNQLSFVFSSSLSSFDRRIIHEICEEFGLQHESKGEGIQRCLMVTKLHEENIGGRNFYSPEWHQNNTSVVLDKPFKYMSCIRNKNGNIQTSSKKQQHTKVRNMKQRLKNLDLNDENDDNFDCIIEKVIKANKLCAFPKCGRHVIGDSQVCQFCKYCFCLTHFLPEIHGCGKEARLFARTQFRKNAKECNNVQKSDPSKRSDLKAKLDKKISELSKQRKAKSS